MEPTLMGAPLGLYGIPCLLLAFIFAIIWPHKLAPERGPRRLVLRWGHTLVWLMLALAAFIGGSPGLNGASAARALAFAAAAVYVVFVFVLLTTPRPPAAR